MMSSLEGLYRRLRFGKPIVVVSGLPRSGTSMTMKMLEAGGVPIVTDGKRTADESNPKGYFEFEPVMRLHEDPDKRWLVEARGKARGGSIPGLFDPSWTTPSAAYGGMHRRSNAAGLSPRAASAGSC